MLGPFFCKWVMNCEAANDEDEAVEKRRTLLIPKLGLLQVEKWREIERKFMVIYSEDRQRIWGKCINPNLR